MTQNKKCQDLTCFMPCRIALSPSRRVVIQENAWSFPTFTLNHHCITTRRDINKSDTYVYNDPVYVLLPHNKQNYIAWFQSWVTFVLPLSSKLMRTQLISASAGTCWPKSMALSTVWSKALSTARTYPRPSNVGKTCWRSHANVGVVLTFALP